MLGINLSGAEFGTHTGNRYWTDYYYPTASEIGFYAGKGVQLIRLPFIWERMQPTLGGPLSSTELGYLKTFLADAHAAGVKVIVDLHNYGRYGGQTIGSDSVSYAQFADFWKKLATELKDMPALVGYDLMNEPHSMGGSQHWPAAAQAAVDAIRTIDMKTAIYVEGDQWATATFWQTHNNNLLIKDPANNIIYQAHLYFDKTFEGVYANSYEADGAYPMIGVDRLQPFLDWLKANNVKGMIGEFGVPSNDPKWQVVLENFLKALQANNMSGTMWGGGFWWPQDYVMHLGTPSTGDSLALDMLEIFMAGGSTGAISPAPSSINGTDAADALNGTDGDDTVLARGGDDQIFGSAGRDSLDGGAGNDSANYRGSTAGVDVDLLRATQLGGFAEGDKLVSIENIVGSNHADRLLGDHAANRLGAGSGDDSLMGRRGADFLDGGEGIDTASYAESTSAVDVDLGRGAQFGGEAAGDVLVGIENLTGSAYNDRLSGDGRSNVLVGGSGADVLNGRGGADVLTGGSGKDRFVFDNAADGNGDRITDFSRGDKIDLSGIDANIFADGNNAFNFIGGSQFTGVAGQLRFFSDATTTYVLGDINGDGVADFQILLSGRMSFNSNDFIL
jgi:Ca2+-binding RTX toxin-like protein